MKNIGLVALLPVLAILMASCGKNDLEPYLILKNDSGQVISSPDSIPVELNTSFKLFVEAGYLRRDGNNMDYDWKTDEGEFVQYTLFDGLDITAMGSNNNLGIEKATLDISFGDDIVEVGSVVTVRVKDQKSLVGQLAFKVVSAAE